jgi:hypothetical protein
MPMVRIERGDPLGGHRGSRDLTSDPFCGQQWFEIRHIAQ